ncbi:hypothetical protein HYH03_003357 [Edaphochlamys debaryana]|uniref:Uncharacterized protein n=1 Tax=Edaphochlamys debaryana TaxID=47281 RepID=A0A835YC86_9CHLO|nr:hypothetical protein HYH03_003357 [Edaphochlamys debaryana]|eukprot:KAG2498608.1 hypothetical protein HYH03_003357 [Edaphochlamys debaryana]
MAKGLQLSTAEAEDLIPRAFPGDKLSYQGLPEAAVRRAIAAWLATSPYQGASPLSARLSSVSPFLCGELPDFFAQPRHKLWFNKLFLAPESRGVFVVEQPEPGGAVWVRLDVAALQRAARGYCDPPPPPSPADFPALQAVSVAGSSHRPAAPTPPQQAPEFPPHPSRCLQAALRDRLPLPLSTGAAAAEWELAPGPELEAARCRVTAKRYLAEVLAAALPGHQLTLAAAWERLPQALRSRLELEGGGSGPPLEQGSGGAVGSLRALCEEEPDVFAVWLQLPSTWVVRLACEELAKLGEEAAAAAQEATSAAATGVEAADDADDARASSARGEASAAAAPRPVRVPGSVEAGAGLEDTPSPHPVGEEPSPEGAPSSPAAAMRELIAAAFPGGGLSARGLPETAMRRVIAARLASSPQPKYGERTALLPQLGEYLRHEHAGTWLNAAYTWPKLCAFLLAKESQQVFAVEARQEGRSGLAWTWWRCGGRRRHEQVLAAPLPPPPLPLSLPLRWLEQERGAAAGPAAEAMEEAASPPIAMGQPAVNPAELVPLIPRAFPGDGLSAQGLPEAAARRAIAAWLASNPCPGLAPHASKLTHLGDHLCSVYADVWHDPAYAWPKLKTFLLASASQGVFVIEGTPGGQEWVRLDTAALRRAAAAPRAVGAEAAAAELPTSASAATAKAPAARAAAGAAAGAVMAAASVRLTQALARRFPHPEHGDAANAGLAASAKRGIARILATAPPPHSMLLGTVGEALNRMLGGPGPAGKAGRLQKLCVQEPDVFRVTTPGVGTVYVALVCPTLLPLAAELAEAERSAPAAALVRAKSATAVGAAMAAGATCPHGAAAAAAAPVLPSSQEQLQTALLSRFPPLGFDDPRSLPRVVKRAVARLLAGAPGHELSSARLRELVPVLLGGTRAPDELLTWCEDEPDVFGVWLEPPSTWTVRLRSEELARLGEAAAPSAAVSPHSPVGAPEEEDVRDLIARALPNTHAPGKVPSNLLRRIVASWLAGSPDPSVGPLAALLPRLGDHLRTEHAGLWLKRRYAWPKLKTFLRAAEGKGVFTVVREPGGREWVRLDTAALRRAAAAEAAGGAAATTAASSAAPGTQCSAAPAATAATTAPPATAMAQPAGRASSASAPAAAAAALPSPQEQLQTALRNRFPPLGPNDPNRLAHVAKRATAQVLAEAPGHELSFARLGELVPKRMGGEKQARKLRALCEEEPDVFAVWLQPPDTWMVRLLGGAGSLEAAPAEAVGATGSATAAAASSVTARAPAAVADGGRAAAAEATESAVVGGDMEAAHIHSGAAALGNVAVAISETFAVQFPPPTLHGVPVPIPVPVPVPVLEDRPSLAPLDLDVPLLGWAGEAATPAAALLPQPLVLVVSDPFTPALAAMLQHCRACTHLGLAVHSYGGAPAVVCLYAPPVAGAVEAGVAGVEAAGTGADVAQAGAGTEAAAAAAMGAGTELGEAEVAAATGAAVYLVDLTAARELHGGGEAGADAERMLLFGVGSLLVNAGIEKVAHGRWQISALEAACGGVVTTPLLDTRRAVKGLAAMLDLPPPPPPPPSSASAATSSSAAAGVSPLSLVAVTAHVSALRSGLAAAGLWADRPDLLAALSAVHFAALRDELGPGEGGGAAWGSRPLSASSASSAFRSTLGPESRLPDVYFNALSPGSLRRLHDCTAPS